MEKHKKNEGGKKSYKKALDEVDLIRIILNSVDGYVSSMENVI